MEHRHFWLNRIVAHDVDRPYVKKEKGIKFTYVGIEHLIRQLKVAGIK